MHCSSNILLLLFVFDIARIIHSHAVLAPRTVPAYISAHSSASVAKPSGGLLTQAQDISQSNTITTTPLGDNTDDRACLFGDAYTDVTCSYTKTADGLALGNLDDQCMLWDSSCSGNRSDAIQKFFGDTVWKMTEKPCWQTVIPECTNYEPVATLTEMSRIEDWMRTPQCNSAGMEFGAGWTPDEPLQSCCGVCWIRAEDVDVYYWPEPNSDNSCLSIIGTEVHSTEYGATKDPRGDYWACTAANATTSAVIPSFWGSVAVLETVATVQSIITTARMTSVGSLTFKQSLVNPWSPPDCIIQTSAPAPPSVSIGSPALHASIQARGHSLVIPSSITQKDGLLVSTVVSGQFTL